MTKRMIDADSAPEIYKLGDIVKIKKGILTYVSYIKSWIIISKKNDFVKLKSKNDTVYQEVSVSINEIEQCAQAQEESDAEGWCFDFDKFKNNSRFIAWRPSQNLPKEA